MNTAILDERRIVAFASGEVAPLAVRCEISVYLSAAHLGQSKPAVELRRVEFADGISAENDSDHARIVAHQYGDPNFANHRHWVDILQRCEKEYRAGLSYLLPPAITPETLSEVRLSNFSRRREHTPIQCGSHALHGSGFAVVGGRRSGGG